MENRPTNKGKSFFIKHTSTVFHQVSCKEKTNNSKTLAQAMQTSALLNNSYLSNDVYDAFYVDYIEFRKYMDDIINSLNVKNALRKKSGSNNDQSKLKLLETEISKIRNENTNLKDDNKSKSELINDYLPLVSVVAQLINNKNLHVKFHSYQNTHTKNDCKQVKEYLPFPCHNTRICNIITSNIFESLYVEDMASNKSRNANFVVTPSGQTKIPT